LADEGTPRGTSVAANHRRYRAMDACLAAAPRAIHTSFFAAAACVTHPLGGLGVLDGALGRWVFGADESALLRFVHGALAGMNHGWFVRLRAGAEVPGCDGLRGRELDHALVELEQARFTSALDDWCANDDARRVRLLAGINEVLRGNLLRTPLIEPRLRAALATARVHCAFDLGDELQRCSIGHALVDLIRADRPERGGQARRLDTSPAWAARPTRGGSEGLLVRLRAARWARDRRGPDRAVQA
jgi:hypothetical protein